MRRELIIKNNYKMKNMKYFSVAMLYLYKEDKTKHYLFNGLFYALDKEEAFKEARFQYEDKFPILKEYILINKNIIEIVTCN